MSTRNIPVFEYTTELSPDTRAEIALLAASQRTLGDVLTWGRAQHPPRVPSEIITQDEFTHDVVMSWGAELYLVYDTT
jgi:hypothetical protein